MDRLQVSQKQDHWETNNEKFKRYDCSSLHFHLGAATPVVKPRRASSTHTIQVRMKTMGGTNNCVRVRAQPTHAYPQQDSQSPPLPPPAAAAVSPPAPGSSGADLQTIADASLVPRRKPVGRSRRRSSVTRWRNGLVVARAPRGDSEGPKARSEAATAGANARACRGEAFGAACAHPRVSAGPPGQSGSSIGHFLAKHGAPFGPLAQRSERLSSEQRVAGSTPVGIGPLLRK